MRLNPFDADNINVGSTGGGFPGGGGGKIGCGTLVIAIVGALVFGLDPMQTIGAAAQRGSSSAIPSGSARTAAIARSSASCAAGTGSCASSSGTRSGATSTARW